MNTNRSRRVAVVGAFVASAATPAHPAFAASSKTPLRHTLRYDDAIAGVLQAVRFNQSPAQGTAASARRFDIAPGPLGTVIAAFEAHSGLTIEAARSGILDVPSPGVSGFLPIEKALEQLLAGTGVSFRFNSPTRVALDIRTESETVRVTAAPLQASVVSPKLGAPLRDIPQSIAVIPQAVIEAQGATTIRDVLRNVTGISIQAGEGGVPAGDNLSIRGFNARTDFFVDGVRDSGGYTRDPFNLEQVQVFKGPSSSYAGRGATGGAVDLVTKAPGSGTLRRFSMGTGSSAYRRSTLDVNQPLGERVAVRLNAMWTDSDAPGRDAVRGERWGVAPSVAVGLGTPTQVTVSHQHLDQHNLPDYGIPWVPSSNTALSSFADRPAPVDYRNFYGLVSRDYENTRTDLATARVDHAFTGSFTLRSLVRYGRTNRDSLITAPRFESNASTAIRRTDWKSRDQADEILASQTDVTTKFAIGATRHTLVTGVELARESSRNYERAELGPAAPSTDLFHPDPGQPYTSDLVRTGGVTRGTATTAAAYVVDTAAIGSHLEVNGSLRVDRFDLDYDARLSARTPTRLSRVDGIASWRGGIVLKPKTALSLYVGAGTSSNPSTEALSLSSSTVDVGPEKTRSLEAGTKWDAAGGRFAVSGAVFRTAKTNARTPGLDPGGPPIVLDGEQVVSGLELEADGRPIRAWQIRASYTFMDSQIRQSNIPDEVGRAFSNAPDLSVSLWSSYDLPFRFTVGGGAQYVGDRFNSSRNLRTAPAYWLADAMASYKVNDQLTLRLNGSNLANTRYIDRVGGGHFIPGAGRAIALTADVGF